MHGGVQTKLKEKINLTIKINWCNRFIVNSNEGKHDGNHKLLYIVLTERFSLHIVAAGMFQQGKESSKKES